VIILLRVEYGYGHLNTMKNVVRFEVLKATSMKMTLP
jgi:hypothetical protein